MTRVLMTTDTIGGVWTYAMDLCRALAPHGVEVVLATMGDLPSEDQRRQAASVPHLMLQTSRFRLEWMPDPWTDVHQAGEWLLSLEKQTRPDVIHLNGYCHGALPWKAPVLVVAHSCVLSWWAAAKRTPLPDEWLDYAAHVSQGLRAVKQVVAPSQEMLERLRSHYRKIPRASVVYNGRSRAPFQAAAKAPFILSAGRLWDEAKNLQALDAIADGLSWPIRVAGETASSTQGTRVQCLGRLNEHDLAALMGQAAIYALPAKYEPFGLSVLEAALSGCALVLGDIPSLREIWGDAASYVSPDDVDALSQTLRRHIEHPSLRIDMAKRARTRGRRYTTARMARKYFSIYCDLLASRSSVTRSGLQMIKG